jgi:hypothetical protein
VRGVRAFKAASYEATPGQTLALLRKKTSQNPKALNRGFVPPFSHVSAHIGHGAIVGGFSSLGA